MAASFMADHGKDSDRQVRMPDCSATCSRKVRWGDVAGKIEQLERSSAFLQWLSRSSAACLAHIACAAWRLPKVRIGSPAASKTGTPRRPFLQQVAGPQAQSRAWTIFFGSSAEGNPPAARARPYVYRLIGERLRPAARRFELLQSETLPGNRMVALAGARAAGDELLAAAAHHVGHPLDEGS